MLFLSFFGIQTLLTVSAVLWLIPVCLSCINNEILDDYVLYKCVVCMHRTLVIHVLLSIIIGAGTILY